MVYRRAHEDERWQQVQETIPEEQLPERYHQTFAAFEGKLAGLETARPAKIQLQDGSQVETYWPQYDAMKTESMVFTLFMVGFLFVMGFVPAALLMVAALLLLPQAVMMPMVLGLYAVTAVVLVILLTPMVRNVYRHNKRKRAAGRRIGFGTYLFEDAILQRQPDGVSYYPRDRVLRVDVDRSAAHTSGGGKHGPTRHHAAASDVDFFFLDVLSREKKATFLHSRPGHEPVEAQLLQQWIARDTDAKADPDYGKHSAEELAREDWAAAWRSYKRRRLWAHILLIGPGVVFITVAIVSEQISEGWIDQALGGYWWLPIVAFFVPGFLAWLWMRAFRCPRCAESPRQPLRGTDVTRCLSCGLPIFTEAHKPAR